MEIIVLVKQVPDVALNIKVKDGEIVEEGLSYVISSWDETALEAALQITEDVGGEVTLLTVGPEKAAESLRKGLAMGAHKAIHVKYDQAGETDSFAYAKILQKALAGRNYDLVLTGRQSQDTDAGLTAPMLAEFLGLPQVTNIIRFSDVSENSITLYRKGDDGTEVIDMSLPGLVTVNDSLNEPRLASMRGIMMAKKKPLEEIDLDSIGITSEMRGIQGSMTQILQFEKPESRKEGQTFEGDEADTVKQAMGLLSQWASSQTETHVTVSGKRGINALKFRGITIDEEHHNFEDKPAFIEVSPIGISYLNAYTRGDIDRLDVVYTRFMNIAKQEAVVETLLPFKPAEDKKIISSHS